MSVDVVARQRLRDELLLEVYNHYFEKGGVALLTKSEKLQEDKEKTLAYQYLEQKGLIEKEKRGQQNIYIKPTVTGIDVVEEDLL